MTSPRAQLRALGLRPARRLSQSFLADESAAAAIVRAAHLTTTDQVLEVGPGLGVLTSRLAQAAQRVVAVEIDTALAEALRSSVPANVQVETADLLRVQPADWFEAPFVVVANLPYHITSPALRHLLAAGPPSAARLIVMVQREVAERIAAPAGQLSALAVAIQAQTSVELVRQIGAASFYPAPKVDSAVLRLVPLPDAQRLVPREQIPAFTSLVQAGFTQPRKTLANSLAQGLAVPKAEAAARLERAAIDPGARPQMLRVEDWARLFQQ